MLTKNFLKTPRKGATYQRYAGLLIMGSLVWTLFVVPVAADTTFQGPTNPAVSMNDQAFLKAISTQKDGVGGVATAFDAGNSNKLEQQRPSLLGRHQDDHGGGGGSSLIFLDTLVIGVLVLVVVGLVTVRFMADWWKGKTRGQNELDRLTEDEWEGRP